MEMRATDIRDDIFSDYFSCMMYILYKQSNDGMNLTMPRIT